MDMQRVESDRKQRMRMKRRMPDDRRKKGYEEWQRKNKHKKWIAKKNNKYACP